MRIAAWVEPGDMPAYLWATRRVDFQSRLLHFRHPQATRQVDAARRRHVDALSDQQRALAARAGAIALGDHAGRIDDAMPRQRIGERRLGKKSSDEPRVPRSADGGGEPSVGADAPRWNAADEVAKPQDEWIGAARFVDTRRRGRGVGRTVPSSPFHGRGTGWAAASPERTATTSRAAISAMRLRVETVAEPMCGSSTAFSSFNSSCGTAGSPS